MCMYDKNQHNFVKHKNKYIKYSNGKKYTTCKKEMDNVQAKHGNCKNELKDHSKNQRHCK